MLYFSGLQRENKCEKSFAWNWLAHVLALFGLGLARVIHFSALPLVAILPRANHAPNAPQDRPACPGSRTVPRRHGKACQFAVILVPVGLQASKHACRQRTNNSLRPVPACVSRLKRRTPHASRHGGAGVRLAARFFPIINHTPPAIFSQ